MFITYMQLKATQVRKNLYTINKSGLKKNWWQRAKFMAQYSAEEHTPIKISDNES